MLEEPEVRALSWADVLDTIGPTIRRAWEGQIPEVCDRLRVRVVVQPRLMDPRERSAMIDTTGPAGGTRSLMALVSLALGAHGSPFSGQVEVALESQNGRSRAVLWSGDVRVRPHGATERDRADERRAVKTVLRMRREDAQYRQAMFALKPDNILARAALIRETDKSRFRSSPVATPRDWSTDFVTRVARLAGGAGAQAANPLRVEPAVTTGSATADLFAALGAFEWIRQRQWPIDITPTPSHNRPVLVLGSSGGYHLQDLSDTEVLTYGGEAGRHAEDSIEVPADVNAWVEQEVPMFIGPNISYLDAWGEDPPATITLNASQVVWVTPLRKAVGGTRTIATVSLHAGAWQLLVDGFNLTLEEQAAEVEPPPALPARIRRLAAEKLRGGGLIPGHLVPEAERG